MAITVTSKYKPFTYEELVKPLEGYWEKYDKQEEDLVKLKTDASAIKSYLDTLPKIEGPNGELVYTEADQQLVNQYNNYIKSIEDISNQMASSGLNYDIKSKAKELPSIYNAQIAPISTAIDRRIKFIDTLRAQEAQGNWVDLDINKLDLASFKDGPLPEYHIADTSYLGNLITTAAASATKSMSLKLSGSKYTVGIKPENYRNGKLTKDQKYITDTLEKEAFQEILKALNMTEEEYNQNISQSRKNQIDDFIKNRIAIGLSYQESPVSRSNNNGGNGGNGGGSEGALNTILFPRETTQKTLTTQGGKSIIIDEVVDVYNAYDQQYNLKAQTLLNELNEAGAYTDTNRYQLPKAVSIDSAQEYTTYDKTNLYKYKSQQGYYSKGVWKMPIILHDKKENKEIVIGYLPIEKQTRNPQDGQDVNIRKQLPRSASVALQNYITSNPQATEAAIREKAAELAAGSSL